MGRGSPAQGTANSHHTPFPGCLGSAPQRSDTAATMRRPSPAPTAGPGQAGPAVVDLDPHPALVPQQPHAVSAAGRDAVAQGVGGELAHAEQQVAPAVCTPRVKCLCSELPGSAHGLVGAREESLPHQGGLNLLDHGAIIALRD